MNNSEISEFNSGIWGCHVDDTNRCHVLDKWIIISRTTWKGRPKRVIASYTKIMFELIVRFLSRTGHEKPCLNLGGPPPKAKYILWSIANKYREGKVKSTPKGEWNRSWSRMLTRSRSRFILWRRAFCRTNLRVNLCSKLKPFGGGIVKASLNRATSCRD